jgi:type II secretory pathway pseudopilin PulG
MEKTMGKSNCHRRLEFAFTLSEVLITIGIIGVVSALTIPTLIKSYQKRVIEVNLKKTYAEIQNIIRQSEVDNGSFEGWDYNCEYSTFVNKYIAPYWHLYQCVGDCFAKDESYISGKTGDAVTSSWWKTMPKFYTKDGRYVAIFSNFDSTSNLARIVFVIDVNGSFGKSVMSQDVFMLSFSYRNNEKRVEFSNGYSTPSSWTIERLEQNCEAKIDFGGEYCGELIRKNGWKFPKNYPFEIGVKSE